MKMYLIAIIIAFIGLWISSEVRADGLCGLRSGRVLQVEDWISKGTKGAIDFTADLRSKDQKAIKSVGGTVQFLLKDEPVVEFGIYLKAPVEGYGVTTVRSTERRTPKIEPLLDADHDEIKVIACVDSIDYVDGSGVIIN